MIMQWINWDSRHKTRHDVDSFLESRKTGLQLGSMSNVAIRPVRESTGCISRNWDKFASAEVIVDQRAPKVWQLGEEMGPDAGRVACVEVIKK